MIQRLPQLPRLRVGMPCGPASPPSFYQRLLCGFGGDISKDGWVLSPGLAYDRARRRVSARVRVLMEHRWHHHRLVFFKQSFGSPKILIIAAPSRYTFGYKHQFGLSTLNVAQPLIIGRLRHWMLVSIALIYHRITVFSGNSKSADLRIVGGSTPSRHQCLRGSYHFGSLLSYTLNCALCRCGQASTGKPSLLKARRVHGHRSRRQGFLLRTQ
jgi:hypothetical protein